MKISGRMGLVMLSFFMAAIFFTSVCIAAEAQRITKEELKLLLGNPGVLILDARTGESWANSSMKIKGAVRVDPSTISSWAATLPKDKKIIVYCS